MRTENKKWLLSIMFVTLFLIVIDATATVTNNYTNGTIWQIINSDTITQNDTSLNVNIGLNESTTYKLEVNGDTLINNLFLYFSDYRNGLSNIILTYFFIPYYGYEHYLTFNNANQYIFDNSIRMYGDAIINGNANISGDINGNSDLTITGQTTSYNFSGYGIVPIGTIEDFFGDAYGLPIPDGWQVCNGSFIIDVDSMLYGYKTPNLTGYFLKGDMQSNLTGGNNSLILLKSQMPNHDHNLSMNLATGSVLTSRFSGTMSTVLSVSVNTAERDMGGNKPFDNQPSYYTCIKIMRIK